MTFNSGGTVGGAYGGAEDRHIFLPGNAAERKMSVDVRRHIRASDHRPTWVGVFTVLDDDHTVGQVLRHALSADPTVIGAGYSIPHPLENVMRLHVQTDDSCSPATALVAAIDRTIFDLHALSAELHARVAARRRPTQSSLG